MVEFMVTVVFKPFKLLCMCCSLAELMCSSKWAQMFIRPKCGTVWGDWFIVSEMDGSWWQLNISVKTSVWTEWIPFVDLFLNFSLSASTLGLISCPPSPPLLQPFFFHSYNKAEVTLPTFLSSSFVIPGVLFLFLALLSLCPRLFCCRHRDMTSRVLESWLDSSPAISTAWRMSTASTQTQCKPLHISKHPAFPHLSIHRVDNLFRDFRCPESWVSPDCGILPS